MIIFKIRNTGKKFGYTIASMGCLLSNSPKASTRLHPQRLLCHGNHGFYHLHYDGIALYKLTQTTHLLFKQRACQPGSPVSSSWQPLQFATRPQTDGQMFVQFHVLTQIPNIFTKKMHLSTFKRSILGQEIVYQPLCRWNSGLTIIETLSHWDSG